MKPKLIVSFVMSLVLCGVLLGQSPTPTPQEQVQQQLQQLSQQRIKELQALQLQAVQQGAAGRGTLVTPFGVAPTSSNAIGSAWWTNPALVSQLGLTDDQKTKIERAFENHRQDLTANTQALEKEEAQLAKLLATDPLDRNAILGEIDRVVQARGELERTNSLMTLEMREVLTAAQWTQLRGSPASNRIYTPFGPIANPRAGAPGQRSTGGQRQQ